MCYKEWRFESWMSTKTRGLKHYVCKYMLYMKWQVSSRSPFLLVVFMVFKFIVLSRLMVYSRRESKDWTLNIWIFHPFGMEMLPTSTLNIKSYEIASYILHEVKRILINAISWSSVWKVIDDANCSFNA